MSKFEGVLKSGVSKKNGTGYATIRIDGAEYLVFDPYVSIVRSVSGNSEVEFTSKPNYKPGEPAIIGSFRVVKAGTGADTVGPGPVASVLQSVSTPARGGAGRESNDVVQLSIFYGYAKDLVTHGIVKSSVSSPEAVVDLIGSLALAFMAAFKKSKDNLTNPTT